MSSSEAEARAFALLAGDRLDEAEAAWRELLARDPADARAVHFLGCVLARGGRVDEGLALLDQSLEREPSNAMFLANRAHVLADAGRIEAAVADLRRAVRADAKLAGAYRHLGLLLERLGRREEALAALRRAVALEPASAAANASLGRVLLESGDAEGARAPLERALEAQPGDADVLNHLGLALAALGLHREAIERYRAALANRPSFARARLHWGHALRESGDLTGAASMYAAALRDRADFLPALLACAGATLDLGDLAGSRALYDRALEMAPGSPDACYGLGQVALREHRFAQGWAGYERRFETDPPQSVAHLSPLPRLDASNLARVRKVLVWGEQGLGDQLLFSTLLPELEARGIEVALDVDARLAPILARTLRGASVVAPRSAPGYDGCDAHIGLGSLGALFRPDLASFARQPAALLRADPARVADLLARLPKRAKRIGISWRSLRDGGRGALALRKSAPLESFAALAAGGASLVDLQYGDVGEERERFEARHPGVLARVPGLDPVDDLEGMLAAIAACDAIVSTSNVTAHLAGAIGKEALLVYLGANAPFSYWVPDAKGRTLWYPSVRVVTAPELDAWETALARAAQMAG